MMIAAGVSWSTAAALDEPALAALENYAYVEHPAGRPAGGDADRLSLVVEHRPGRTLLSLVTLSARSEEAVVVSLLSQGFATATRETRHKGVLVARQVVRRDGDRVEIESHEGERVERKDVRLADAPLAVDASLLLFFRSFVEAAPDECRVFMVDFSGRSISVNLRKRGTEYVSVPAGTFQCHKLEVVVRFLIFEAVITYWVSVEAPHFLVKHVGKRGPFTRTTVTELVERSHP
jgi:hypothetical protein